MKKNFLFAAIVVAVIGAAGLVESINAKTESEIALDENVEALASGESTETIKTCYETITSKEGSMVLYCPVCDFIPGTDTWYTISSTCVSVAK